jgi:DNA-binding protein H-NS
VKLDMLESLNDDDLRAVIGRADTLLKAHDTERKDKALCEARTLLASVGLSLRDLARKAPAHKAKGPVYHSGRQYQHPANKTLVWTGKGKKPRWLTALEAEGEKAIEISREAANDNAGPLRKTG